MLTYAGELAYADVCRCMQVAEYVEHLPKPSVQVLSFLAVLVQKYKY
jgi:hypothetical protein